MKTLLEKAAEWAAGLRFEDLPARVIERSKWQLLSTMAALYSGYPLRAVRSLREIALSTRAQGRSRVFPQGDHTSPTVAVVANSAASMALEYDDYLFCGHTGHSAVLATLALAEELGASGRQFLVAQAAANEIGGRLGAAVMLGPQNGQLWTFLHGVCAAAAAGKLLELDARMLAHALALVLYQPPLALWPGFFGRDAKLLSAAFPARDGILAARAAAWGLSGPLDILENPRGFGASFARLFLSDMFSAFGRAWVSDTVSIKTVPGCAYLTAAVQAMEEALERFRAETGRPLEPADVIEARVQVNLLGLAMDALSRENGAPLSRTAGINFSLPYSLAAVMLAGALTPAELSEEWISKNAEQLSAAAARVRVIHDWELTMKLIEEWSAHFPLASWIKQLGLKNLLRQIPGVEHLQPERLPKAAVSLGKLLLDHLQRGVLGRKSPSPAAFSLERARLERLSMPFGARIELQLRRRRELTARVDIPAGAAGRPVEETRGLVRRKFRLAARPYLGEEQTEKVLELISRLEELEAVDQLGRLLCVPA
jgi:2-methylcitrate dehydratase PrpD